MSLRLGNTIIAGGTNKNSLLEFKWSDHKINDMSWVLADTFSWQSGDVYKNAYDLLLAEYNNGEEHTSPDWMPRWKTSPNGFIITTPEYEQNVIDRFNSYGIAWIYIIDIENRRFKLPRTKYGFNGFRGEVGVDIDESLPNITGSLDFSFGGQGHTEFVASGAFTREGQGNLPYPQPATNTSGIGRMAGFSASRSSSTYKDNAPVQERATQMYLYFYVGEFAQSAIEQTAGITTEVLNNKVDTSADNFNEIGKSNIADVVYPVGSIYIGIQNECPMKAVIQGSEWVKVSEGRVLQGSDSSHTAGSTIEAGLPQIYGNIATGYNVYNGTSGTVDGAFAKTTSPTNACGSGGQVGFRGADFYASRSSSIYGNSTTVQPPAFVVNIWQRTA